MKTAVNPVPNVRVEMKRHRNELRQAVHPGRTQKEAGFTPSESRWLTIGVCNGIACDVERGERIANWAVAALAVLLLLVIGAGVVKDRWAEKTHMQTVEAQ